MRETDCEVLPVFTICNAAIDADGFPVIVPVLKFGIEKLAEGAKLNA